MTFSIPIYVEEKSSGLAQTTSYSARPLFLAKPVQRAEKLSRALARLSSDLQEELRALGEEPRHDRLAAWTFSPVFEEATLELRLALASGSQKRFFFFVGYSALDRKLFFTPLLPATQFELLPGQSLPERATEVLTRRFRQLEKEDGGFNLDDYALNGKARLTILEVSMQPAARAKQRAQSSLAAIFGGNQKMNGEQELRKTGRSLQSMYPDDLGRALGRDREVSELAGLLTSADRRPVLLIGRRKVGKTVILHELAWQMCARKKERFGGGREIWLLSPMRLISGMSYLGQWENRVMAILDVAKNKDHVLYFEDLPGLFAAGKSAASDLNVALILKPYLDNRTVRVAGEITPEEWQALREMDRGFADLFHIIPIPEPSVPETLRILVDVARQLEEEHRCEFDLEVVPAAYELHRRFVTDAAFPGKAAGFLRRLAVRFAGAKIGREFVLEEFRTQSGLELALLDDRRPLKREIVVQKLRDELAGQDHVLEAFADVVLTLKARMNDPKRPLGAFLLLGPTGVGKTQAAKAFAGFLFGSSERLLRFDMNEYVDGGSASRLVGTAHEPDGLLTGAVRRQPFSVVLFDEIEKASPEVFDLLLAVLDEGRLTDAFGRAADFTQCMILLTSNLGVSEARSRLGFGAAQASSEADDAIYAGAAEKFFRPEFFNRLDRIIPFRSLDKASLAGIARQLVQGIFARDGLRRRNGLLSISDDAMNRLVQLGHHPQLGARALKRVIEREVAQPLGEKLSALAPGAPMIANVTTAGEGFALAFRELQRVERTVQWPALASARAGKDEAKRTTHVLDAIHAVLGRIEAQLEACAPAGKIELGNVAVEHARYFLCREQLKKAEDLARAVEYTFEKPHRPTISNAGVKSPAVKLLIRQVFSANPRFDRRRDAAALRVDMDDLHLEMSDVPDSSLLTLLRELALLEAIAATSVDHQPAMLTFQACQDDDIFPMFELARGFSAGIGGICGANVTNLTVARSREEIVLSRVHRNVLARAFSVYLTGLSLGRLIPHGSHTISIRQGAGAGIGVMTLERALSEAESGRSAMAVAESRDIPALETFGPVIFEIAGQSLTDLRTGLVIDTSAPAESYRALLLSALPLPVEVERAIKNFPVAP